ncbi:hypothetical protein BG003_004398 [Podila horticola]|nr:hypothetical protein BG003_004398 [Podila horticola]
MPTQAMDRSGPCPWSDFVSADHNPPSHPVFVPKKASVAIARAQSIYLHPIEGLDTLSVQQVFTQRAGSRTIKNEAFSVKACRMPFRKPTKELIPLFVQNATREYEAALAEYNKRLATLGSSFIVPSPPKPLPPTIQYRQRNLRLYPETHNSPHPAFRVSFVVSKKLVSKLAIHRNLARKKLSAAVESTFKEHARPGFEYLVFAAQKVMTTPQDMLIEMMKNVLTNPGLYSESNLRVEEKLKADARKKSENNESLLRGRGPTN